MKSKIFLPAAMLFCLSLTTFGQSCPPGKTHGKEAKMDMKPEYTAKHEAEKAQTKLGLNTDQASKWEQAALARINANMPYRQKMSGSTTPEERKELKTKMKANRNQFNTTVTEILTPEQKTKWESIKKENGHGMDMRKGMRHDGTQKGNQ